MLFRVLFAGSAGRAAVGGPKDGREGRGIDAAILKEGRVGSERCRRTSAPRLS